MNNDIWCAWHCCQNKRHKDYVLCNQHASLEQKWGRLHHFKAIPQTDEIIVHNYPIITPAWMPPPAPPLAA
jgi:hypothetical protein